MGTPQAPPMAVRSGVSAPPRVFLLRLSSVVAGAAAFGLVAAPVIDLPTLPAAFVLAFGFGFFFIGGTGYRIVLAVALRDSSRPAAASWSGATAVSAIAVLAAALALAISGRNASLVLAAYAVAINLAYLPVKLACLEAGCCRAVCDRRTDRRSADLRLAEIAMTVACLAAAAVCLGAGAPAGAAALGLSGHLATRLVSRWARRRLPIRVLSPYGRGQEIAPLVTIAGWALGLCGG